VREAARLEHLGAAARGERGAVASAAHVDGGHEVLVQMVDELDVAALRARGDRVRWFGGRSGGYQMALYAFDGTGQRDDNPELEDVKDTNVARFFFAYRPDDSALPIDDRHNHYQRGVGSAGLLRKALGTITGFGGRTFVRRAIGKLKDNIEGGDTTIDVVGFSRGAALALDFVNEIAKGKAKLPDGKIPEVRFQRVVTRFRPSGVCPLNSVLYIKKRSRVAGPYLRLAFGLFVVVLGVSLIFGASRRLGWI